MNLLPITGDFVRALGWTILHSMWQAFFIHACLRIVLKLWPQAGARIKYSLSLLSLSGIFTWFLATLYIHIQRLHEAKEALAQIGGTISLQGNTPLPAVYPSQDPLVWLFPNLELCFPFLVTLYIIGITIMTVKLLSDLFQLHKIRTARIASMGPAWEKHLDKMAARLRIPRKVKLLISRHVQVPVMLGFLKPLILLPVAMVNNLTEEQLEAVLLHELAHIKRNDYLLNIFQSIVETILFFNPFVWLISKTIRMEREHCCDDLVIASTAQPLQYAHALVALEEYRLTANRLSMAAADNKQHLFHRIKRIMEMKTKHLNYSQKFLAVLIIAGSLVSIAWLNPSRAKTEEAVPGKAAIKIAADSVSPRVDVVTTIDDNTEVTTSSSATATPLNFQYQLALATQDTLTPTAPIAPTAPSAPLAPAAPAAPLAPLAPLDGDESQDQINFNYDRNTDSSHLFSNDNQADHHFNNVQRFNFNYQFNQDKEEFRRQMVEVQKSIQQAMKQLKEMDMKKMQADIQAATKNINWQEASDEARKASAEALKNIDWEKISKAQEQATQALKNIDFESLNKSLKDVYKNGYSKEISEKVRNEMAEGFRRADLARQKAYFNLDEVRKHREEALANAAKAREAAGKSREAATGAMVKAERARREAAKAEIKNNRYKEMISKMAADNLLDTQKKYSVEKNDKGLFINGVKQSDRVTRKYQQYLNSKRLTIKGSADSYMVNTED